MPLFRPSVDVRPVTEFRAHTSAVLEQVQATKRPVVLTQHGRSAAVLLDVELYEQLVEELALLRDLATAEAQLDAGLVVPHEAVAARLREQLAK
jgi:prevent-host-death family protein